MQMLRSQAPCIVAMEACATSHDWSRVAQGRHDVRLSPPIYVMPFVKRQKSDAVAIAEAVLRSNIHYVAVKSTVQQVRHFMA